MEAMERIEQGVGGKDYDKTPLISGAGVRRRRRQVSGPRYEPTDWDEALPYGGKVYLARRKLPDSWACVAVQVLVVAAGLGMLYWALIHPDHLHFHMTKAYAHLGHKEAQATVGHKLLHGKGVEENRTLAMEWFRKAAEQGHPQAAYNLAVGHLQGHDGALLKKGEAHQLIRHAAQHGVPEAAEVLQRVCSKGHCDQ